MTERTRAQRSEAAPPPGDPLRAAALTVALFSAVLLLIAAGALAYSFFGEGDEPPRAAIVDQLSLTAPNPAFAEEATALLEEAGYEVDYYPGQWVTVDFYRQLPKLGHEIVLLRAHAGRHEVDGVLTDDTQLFTSEPYTPMRHIQEQRAGRLSIAIFDRGDPEDSQRYFGISADFITSSMQGRFDGATIILMGCDVLRGQRLAEAFVERGASAVVGWDAPVSADHTDAATLSLLRHYLFEDLSVQEAATLAMDELGPDPYYDSVLLSYPSEGSARGQAPNADP